MRLALISDLHGNLIALERVLADIAARGVDRIVCLGDVATLGPRPVEVVQRLQDLGCSCILGNHDEFLFHPAVVKNYTEVPVIIDAIDWCRDQLSTDALDFVGRFESSLELELEGDHRILLYHGTPASNTTDLLSTTPVAEVDRMLSDLRATVLAGGHTHLQMVRQHRGRLLVNPGSVGMPFEEYVGGGVPAILPFAEYAIVHASKNELSVRLHRVLLDKKRLFNEAVAVESPIGPSLSHMYH